MAESKRVQRLLRVFIALDEHPIIGLSNKDLSVGLGLTPSQVSRDIDDLVASGLVIKLENGNYAYGTRGIEDLAGITLMSDGTTVYECTSPSEVIDLVQAGQGVFGIEIGRAHV